MNLRDYNTALCRKLCDNHFSNKENVSGNDLLNFTTDKQVNLFLIYLLMKYWQEETEKIKSHYFNYNAPEVQEAMKQFMNVLSKNISIKKEHFEPMLQKACEMTFELAQNPENFIVQNNLQYDVEGVKKYIHYHKNYFENLGQFSGESMLDEVLKNMSSVVEFKNESIPSAAEQKIPVIEEKSTTQPSSKNNLKSVISIHQRFLFINTFFNKNENEFNLFLEKLDDFKTLAEAEKYTSEIFKNIDDEDALEELYTLIQRKYSIK